MAATVRAIMTGSIRLYVEAPLEAGQSITASGAQAHYLVTVMRRGVGNPVHLFNGSDGEFAARISMVRKDRVELRIERQVRPQTAEPDVWLLFALVKRDATDLIVQKATELGVSKLRPVITDRSNAHRTNAERLHTIAVEAAEQCERLTIPHLVPPRRLLEVLADWPSERRLFAALERSSAQHLSPTPGPIALLVGPEGGFTSSELDALRTHPLVTPVSLGPRVLRADTACIAGLALLQGGDCA
jgi:16S rRNA (uracil1498-N3)-methyltransferase